MNRSKPVDPPACPKSDACPVCFSRTNPEAYKHRLEASSFTRAHYAKRVKREGKIAARIPGNL